MIVAPERETPGTSASACAKPITMPSAAVDRCEVAVVRADLLRDSSTSPSTISVMPIR